MPSEDAQGLYFVYRTHYEGPLSKRIRRLPDRSVLAWFQRGWQATAKGEDYEAWIEAELGGGVYGLDSIFDEVRVRRHLGERASGPGAVAAALRLQLGRSRRRGTVVIGKPEQVVAAGDGPDYTEQGGSLAEAGGE